MLNGMFFLLSYLHQCAFTANPEEITVMMMMMKLPILPCAGKLELVLSTARLTTVNNFASTFDNADHSS